MDGGDRRFTGTNHDNSIMNQIMLKFRPIAPKPVTDGSGYADLEKKEVVVKKRSKKNYVRVCKKLKSSVTKKNKSTKSGNDWFDETVVTLELLPKIGENSSESVIDCSVVQKLPGLVKVSENNYNSISSVSDVRVVESWVVLESVTGVYGGDGRMWLGRDKLEKERCPCFVSEGDGGVVRWVNLAYKRMVEAEEEEEVKVWLMMEKEKIPVAAEAFSCRVRVVYGGRWKVVPCDVWRMDLIMETYAWRLDLEAALTLGR